MSTDLSTPLFDPRQQLFQVVFSPARFQCQVAWPDAVVVLYHDARPHVYRIRVDEASCSITIPEFRYVHAYTYAQTATAAAEAPTQRPSCPSLFYSMFKKHIAVVQTRPLSGKDGKKLRKDIERLYPNLSDDDHKRLFANKADVNLMRLSNKAQVYACNGGNPLFFDPTGREDVLIPTMYALWLCPQLLPTLFTHSEVSPKVSPSLHSFTVALHIRCM